MNQPRQPTPGRYRDSCRTPYEASHHPKTGWWIKKLSSHQPAYPKPDFPAAVAAGIFTPEPATR